MRVLPFHYAAYLTLRPAQGCWPEQFDLSGVTTSYHNFQPTRNVPVHTP